MEPGVTPLFLAEVLRLRLRDGWTRTQILARQRRQLRRIRRHALAASPFYREHHAGYESAPFTQLPVLTKSTLMARFDDIITDRRVRLADIQHHMETNLRGGRFQGRYRVTTTGGTSGETSLMLFDRTAWARVLAGATRSTWWAGRPGTGVYRTPRTASVMGAVPYQTTAKMMKSFQTRLAPRLLLDAASPTRHLVAELNRWQPDILVGFSSVVRVLAEEQLAGRLAIHPLVVRTSGERLTEDTRARVAEAWGEPPFDIYAASEGGTLGLECREGRNMHLVDDEALIEIVDEENQPVPPGTWGAKVLVTPFWNARQPLIRYVLEDVVRVSDRPCPCGRPFPVAEAIAGRTFDVLHFPGADGADVPIFPISLGTVVTSIPATWWDIRQDGNTLLIYLHGVPDGYDFERVADATADLLAEHGASGAAVEIRVVDAVPRTAAGKARSGTVAASRPTRHERPTDALEGATRGPVG